MTRTREELARPERYDEVNRRCTPRWEAFYGAVTDMIPEGRVRILELGPGTGFLTALVRRSRPEASLTCLERDPGSLAIAGGKPELAGVHLVEGDFAGEWPVQSPEVVLATFCLATLPREDRARVFNRIFLALPAGGRFISGDNFAPDQEWERDLHLPLWLRSMQVQGMDPEEADLMAGSYLAVLPGLPTCEEYCQELRAAGFPRVTAPYRHWFFGVVAAFR